MRTGQPHHRKQPWTRSASRIVAVFTLIGVLGCRPGSAPPAAKLETIQVAPGVVFVRDRIAGVAVFDVDFVNADITPVVVASNVERIRNNYVGDAKTVRDWVEDRGALAGVNAGFFGDTYPKHLEVERKQIVGLTVLQGKVLTPGLALASKTNPDETYLRATLGFTKAGVPDITYATGSLTEPMRRYPESKPDRATGTWNAWYAVQCGPRLFVRGKRQIKDSDERLVSPGALPRTFVAYSLESGVPRYMLLGVAEGMSFEQVADYLEETFTRRHNARVHDAMCLDGGPSSQIAYRAGVTVVEPLARKTTVPTAILLMPRRTAPDSAPRTPEEAVRRDFDHDSQAGP